LAYLALYRQWRPRTFSEVVGQQHIVRTLKNALEGGRLAHAYLFAGPRGTGKTTIAKVLSRAVNCEQPDGVEPCNQCAVCREILTGNNLDVIELDAASNRGIDEIRALRERAQYAPGRCRHKVYIVDEVHMLTQEAFNALLKTLEEPPRHVLFILATTEPHKLPPTILSRCQRFDFHQLSPAEIDRRLRRVTAETGAEVDDEALALICRYANGAMRDALSLLDQCLSFSGERLRAEDVIDLLGTAPRRAFSALTAAVAGGDAAGVLQRLAGLIDEGRDPAQLARDWVAHARNLLLAASGCDLSRLAGLGPEAAREMAAEAATLGRTGLVDLITILSDTEAQMRWASQPRLLLEVAAVRLAAEPGAPEDDGAGRDAPPPRPADRDAKPEKGAAGAPVGTAPEKAATPAPNEAKGPQKSAAEGAADDGGPPPPPPAEPAESGAADDADVDGAADAGEAAAVGEGTDADDTGPQPPLDLDELRRRWPDGPG